MQSVSACFCDRGRTPHHGARADRRLQLLHEPGQSVIEVSFAPSIGDGDRVMAWNERGRVGLVARITDAVKPGVVYSAKGTWLASSPTGRTVNVLISADVRADIERGACYNETRVDIALTQ